MCYSMAISPDSLFWLIITVLMSSSGSFVHHLVFSGNTPYKSHNNHEHEHNNKVHYCM